MWCILLQWKYKHSSFFWTKINVIVKQSRAQHDTFYKYMNFIIITCSLLPVVIDNIPSQFLSNKAMVNLIRIVCITGRFGTIKLGVVCSIWWSIFFSVYFTTLQQLHRLCYHWVVEWLWMMKLGRMWKQAVISCFRYFPACAWSNRKSTRNLRIVGFWAKNQTQYISNVMQEC